MTTLTVMGVIIITALVLSFFEIEDPVTRLSPRKRRKQPRDIKGRWAKRLPLEIIYVTPKFRRVEERKLVRV